MPKLAEPQQKTSGIDHGNIWLQQLPFEKERDI